MQEYKNEDLLYIIFYLLVVPFKKEILIKIKKILIKINDTHLIKDNKDNNVEIIDSFRELCEKNENSIEGYFSESINLYDNFSDKELIDIRINSASTILNKLDSNYFFYNSLQEIITNLLNKIDFISCMIGQVNCFMALKYFPNKEIFNKIIETINILLKFANNDISINELSEQKQYINELKENITKLEKDKSELESNIKKMQEDVKKNTPLVQLSTFGIFITLLMPPIGMLYTASAGFHMLKENVPFYKSLFLLSFVVICILAFIYIMQRIFFKGVSEKDKQHISAKIIFYCPSLFILIAISVLVLIVWVIERCFLD